MQATVYLFQEQFHCCHIVNTKLTDHLLNPSPKQCLSNHGLVNVNRRSRPISLWISPHGAVVSLLRGWGLSSFFLAFPKLIHKSKG